MKNSRFGAGFWLLPALLLSPALAGCLDLLRDTPSGNDGGGEAADLGPVGADLGPLGADSGPADLGPLGADNGPADLGPAPADAAPDAGSDPLRLGSAATFEVATWNLNNFPTVPQTPARLAELIARMDLDLVAVEEVSDTEAFAQVLAQLGTHQGVLSPDQYQPDNYQKTGFIYRSSQLTLVRSQAILKGDSSAFPRPPLEAEFVVQRPSAAGVGPGEPVTITAIVVHLKASPGEENEARRRSACQKLKAHIDALRSAGTETQVLLLGDMNDAVDDPPANNVFTALLQDATYHFLTAPLAEQHVISYLPYPGLIDHIVVTTELEQAFPVREAEAVPLDQLVEGFGYEDVISDHRPVVGIFGWN